MNNQNRIKNFPISFFSIILGMAGFTIAIQKTEGILKSTINLNLYLLGITVFMFSIIAILYIYKFIKYTEEVKLEFKNPVKLSFFPTISISLLLLSVAFLDVNLSISKILWYFGTIIHAIFTYKIISVWMFHPNIDIKNFNPAWFIPVVGNIIVPIAGVKHFNIELSWFFYSIGLLFWIVLFTIFIYRIIFHHPLPEKLLPTLAILISPPAIGFISYVKLTHSVDSFARILYYFALFLTTFLLKEYKLFSRIKFYLSWWAYTFPISAMTIATALMYHMTKVVFYKYLMFSILIILIALVVIILPMTISKIIEKGICIEED
ncbi:hypothetical protein CLTEP_12240 [Clostridium tepidiprofundi DSM 19306]|uniref:Tellurite resistance protein TehA n=1 Tax=Clostridium tepidiprofundi DSM 19306 TaxID=1121338 RepID=A0A151B4C3_9CLOT|nr:SLAC1 anion channel family protein [Clostridium tepidiprofundi]KYH34759.1 hypothetical protein CLTEP_12240 [Clostridium tepidiprofundi DSM 19306]